MKSSTLPITALPAWSKLNDVHFLDVSVSDLSSLTTTGAETERVKGFGILTTRSLSSIDTFGIPTLLTIPHDLILCAEFVEEHAKVDSWFKEVLERTGGISTRSDIMLFLLMQITIASPHHGLNVGLSNPWSEYCKMLPRNIPVPTMWSEDERTVLVGTSIEKATSAKYSALTREFNILKEATHSIPWCQTCWWSNSDLTLADWILIDAWYRSRCLDLPLAGESMVPCIDMVNHSVSPNSYYEQSSSSNATLLLPPGLKLKEGEELTISYGAEKSNAEMLFSYGFIDEDSTVEKLTLSVNPFPDDPFGKAKVMAFGEPATLTLTGKGEDCGWTCPFLYLMGLNEEDGLDFKVLQQTDGSRSPLRVFWQGEDVTEKTKEFESLTKDHEMKDVFQLRVVALLQERIREQLERLYDREDEITSLVETTLTNSPACNSAMKLRSSERQLLEKAYNIIESQKSQLLQSPTVLRYLRLMDDQKTQVYSAEPETNEDEDFS